MGCAILCAMALVAWIYAMIEGGSGGAGAPAPFVPSEFNASTDCKGFVKRQLRAPATADFAPHRELTIGNDGARWSVSGYVDAQNGFGAMIRSHYTCVIRYDGRRVTAESLEIR